MLRLRYHDPRAPSERCRRLLAGVAAWLRRTQPIPDRLRVLVVPHPTVRDPRDGACGFGVFAVTRGSPQIVVATGLCAQLRREGGWEAAADFLCTTLLHEFVHYEQFRDGRPVREQGVARRVRTLLAACCPNRKETP